MCHIPEWNVAGMLLATVVCGIALLGQSAARPGTTMNSYDGPEGHRMIVTPGGEFKMGSPVGERGRTDVETPHWVRIPRIFAIATKEVTNEQFNRFLAAVPDYAARWKAATTARLGDPPRFSTFSRTPDSPQVG
jgi:formylglycine-generating enzyme required for sulfatase activity